MLGMTAAHVEELYERAAEGEILSENTLEDIAEYEALAAYENTIL